MHSSHIRQISSALRDPVMGSFIRRSISVLVEHAFAEGRKSCKDADRVKVVRLSEISGGNLIPLALMLKFHLLVEEAVSNHKDKQNSNIDDTPLGELGGVFFGPSKKERAIRYSREHLVTLLPEAIVLALVLNESENELACQFFDLISK